LFQKIKNIISYIIMLILLLIAALFYRQAFLVMLLLIMCILPVLSIRICRYTFDRLKTSIRSASYESQKGLTIPLTLCLHNPLFFPLLHVECTLEIRSQFYPKKEAVTYILPATARKDTPLVLPVTYAHCGLFQIKLLSVKTYDYLHFMSFSREETTHCQVIILPDSTTEVSFHPTLYGEGFDEYESSQKKGNASANVTDIREYQPGDRLQLIHWKLSAKIDKLMVKENESTSSHQFFVLLELFYDEKYPDLLDKAIEYAYSLSRELILAGENFFFGYYSTRLGEFASFPIHTQEDLIRALCEAFYETPYTEKDLGRNIFEGSGMIKGTLLQVTHEGVFDEIAQKIS